MDDHKRTASIIASRPGVELRCEEDSLVLAISGWRRLFALGGGLRVPLTAVADATADPDARSRLPVGAPRPRASRSAPVRFRYGGYPGPHGWAFWAIGSGQDALVVELETGRYRFLVVEVEDPQAAALEVLTASRAARRQDTIC